MQEWPEWLQDIMNFINRENKNTYLNRPEK